MTCVSKKALKIKKSSKKNQQFKKIKSLQKKVR